MLMMFLLKSIAPEKYDDAIRRLKWARDNDIDPNEGRELKITINSSNPDGFDPEAIEAELRNGHSA